jgi:hypothetical protein
MIVVDTARMAKGGLIALRETPLKGPSRAMPLSGWNRWGAYGVCAMPGFYDPANSRHE